MLEHILHIGITVSDLDRSVAFYRDVLGLKYIGEIVMNDEETEILFGRKGASARVAYLSGAKDSSNPPVELIQFTDQPAVEKKMDIFTTGISELCFYAKDIEKFYNHLVSLGVECFSKPQPFDFTKDGFGKSKAIYFRDPDGVILEVIEPIE